MGLGFSVPARTEKPHPSHVNTSINGPWLKPLSQDEFRRDYKVISPPRPAYLNHPVHGGVVMTVGRRAGYQSGEDIFFAVQPVEPTEPAPPPDLVNTWEVEKSTLRWLPMAIVRVDGNNVRLLGQDGASKDSTFTDMNNVIAANSSAPERSALEAFTLTHVNYAMSVAALQHE